MCIIYILVTRLGKSLLFLLLTFLKLKEITITIIPFIALKDDLYKMTINLNINIKIFEDLANNNVSLQLISIKNINSNKFINFIKRNSYKKTIYLIINKVYIIIT